MLFQQPGKLVADDIRARGYVVARVRVGLLISFQRVADEREHADRSGAGGCFGGLFNEIVFIVDNHGVIDGDRVPDEIDVAPFDGADLRASKAATGGQKDRDLQIRTD